MENDESLPVIGSLVFAKSSQIKNSSVYGAGPTNSSDEFVSIAMDVALQVLKDSGKAKSAVHLTFSSK
ncbi:hypothetical protein CEXT_575461 [Caerostris extrusa]|uniref:Uncharacterized protein n=1 Tax=Caerostris extrusa TaxID=172846 RepID=A0AAV4SD34_CAEEX|nr:hypothetical protein CEXT_575461 [Caerostris extrusa]